MAGSLLLIHGAGSGPWVFDGWEGSFTGWQVERVDLHEGLDVGSASMEDYASRVTTSAARSGKPVVLCGWSMGGLVALMAAQAIDCAALVVIEPSPPQEVQGSFPDAPLGEGTFDPEAVYGRFPRGEGARPESQLARGERKRGISVPRVNCPMLVISGDEFGDDRGTPIAAFYGAEHAHFSGLDHWALLRDADVRRKLAAFVNRSATGSK